MKHFLVVTILINIWATITAHPSGGVVEIEKQRLIKFPDDTFQYQTIKQSDETRRILEEINKININLGYVKKDESIIHQQKMPTILNSEQYLYPRPSYHHPGINGGVVLPPSIRNLRYKRPINRNQYNYRANNYNPYNQYENYYHNIYLKVPILHELKNFNNNDDELIENNNNDKNFIQNFFKSQKLNNMYKINLVGDFSKFMKIIEDNQNKFNKENNMNIGLPLIFLPAKLKTYEEIENELLIEKNNENKLKKKTERQRVNNKIKDVENSIRNKDKQSQKLLTQQTELQQQQQQQRLKFGIFNRPPTQNKQQIIATTLRTITTPSSTVNPLLLENSIKMSNIKYESDEYDDDSNEDNNSSENSVPNVKHLLAQFQKDKQQEQKETLKSGGIIIQRLKVRKGGIAIAGPGGVATAGSGGTAIVGPGGYALTHPKSLTIAGPGAKIIAYPETVNLGEAALKTRNNRIIPDGGKIVATGPTIYYNPEITIYQTGNIQTWPLYALPFPQLPIIQQSSQLPIASQLKLQNQILFNSLLNNNSQQKSPLSNLQNEQSFSNQPNLQLQNLQTLQYPWKLIPLTYSPLQHYQFGISSEETTTNSNKLLNDNDERIEPTTQQPNNQDKINSMTINKQHPEKLINNKKSNLNVDKSIVTDIQYLQAIQQPNNRFIIDKIISVPGKRLFHIINLENNSNKQIDDVKLLEKEQKLILNKSQKLQLEDNSNNDIEDTTVKVEATGNTAADKPIPSIPIDSYFVPYFGHMRNENHNDKQQEVSLILEPQANAIVGNGGTAISAPISRAILKHGVNTKVFFKPQSVAIAGAGGTAHAQADLILDYVNRRK